MLRVTGPEATSAFQCDHICAGLKAVIDGELYGVQAVLDTKPTTENWVFLIVDAKNAFNDINQIRSLWTVCGL